MTDGRSWSPALLTPCDDLAPFRRVLVDEGLVEAIFREVRPLRSVGQEVLADPRCG